MAPLSTGEEKKKERRRSSRLPISLLLFFLYPSPSLSALTDGARDRATAAAAADATGGR
jgi:hypothetical protein